MIKKPQLFFILLIIIVLVAFSPCLRFQFLHWDDYSHYVFNPCVYSLSWYNICNIFRQTVNDTYIPLTTLSFNLEYHLFGLSPFISHLINVLLHLALVLVIYDFAQILKFSPWESFIACVFFAINPIHVESVAWVTERKDVLGVLFYVLCLKHYWLYLKNNSNKGYVLSIIFGFLSVLTKSMAVSLPWILLLLDWFARRRNSKTLWLDKLPFAILLFPVSAITFFKLSPHPDIAHNPVLIGLWTFSWYLEKFLLPFNLLPAYSPPAPVVLSNVIYLKALVIFVIFMSSLFLWRKNRLFVFACLFWIGTIFFFWRFNFNDIDIVADRFMYLPSLGFCLCLGRYLSRFKAIVLLMVMVLGFLTFNQCQIWRDDMALWTWTISHDPQNTVAKVKQDEAIYYSRRKTFDYKALAEAIDKNPLKAKNYLTRGEALLEDGNYSLALSDFNKAIQVDPLNYMAYNMRGQLDGLKGENKKALEDFDKAVALDPKSAIAYMQKASILESMHDIDQALILFDKAIKIDPKLPGVYQQRGILYKNRGAYSKAIDDFSLSIALGDALASSYFRRGECYESLQQLDMAIADFKKSLKEDRDDIKVLNELGFVYMTQRNYEKAVDIFNKIVVMHPYNKDAYTNRGIIYIRQKQYGLALNDFTDVINMELYPYHELITRGDIYFVMGERQKALEDYNRAVLFSDGDPIAGMKSDHLEHVLAGMR